MFFAIFIIELILLYFLSNRLTNVLYHLFLLIFRNNHIAFGILTFLYLPGTVSHEFAHLISAEILRVPTHGISFTPQIESLKNNQQEIEMGSVKIGHSDPLRKLLIGIAPVLWGLFFLFLLVWLWQYFYPQMQNNWQQIGLTVLIGYFLFAVSNSMFSSSSDIKDTWFIPILLVFIVAALYFAGVRISLQGKLMELISQIFTNLAKSLGIVLAINSLILFLNLLILNKFRRY